MHLRNRNFARSGVVPAHLHSQNVFQHKYITLHPTDAAQKHPELRSPKGMPLFDEQKPLYDGHRERCHGNNANKVRFVCLDAAS